MMSELEIGDQVQTGTILYNYFWNCIGGFFFKIILLLLLFYFSTVSSDRKLTHNKVKAFLKKIPSMITKYKSISTSLNRTISLSGNHLIYARKNWTEKFNQM